MSKEKIGKTDITSSDSPELETQTAKVRGRCENTDLFPELLAYYHIASDLKNNNAYVILMLYRFLTRNGTEPTYITQIQLAILSGLSLATVGSAVKQLVSKEYITITTPFGFMRKAVLNTKKVFPSQEEMDKANIEFKKIMEKDYLDLDLELSRHPKDTLQSYYDRVMFFKGEPVKDKKTKKE